MKTIIFINDKVREVKREYEFIFTPFLYKNIAFCEWDPQGENEFQIFPNLYNLINEDEDWKAIILSNNDLNLSNPYDQNSELIKISHILGKIYSDKSYDFINNHGKRKIRERIIDKNKDNELKKASFLSVKRPLEVIFVTPTKNKHYLVNDIIGNFSKRNRYSPNSKFIIYPFSLAKKKDKLNWFMYFSFVLLLSIQLINNDVLKREKLYYAQLHLDIEIINDYLKKNINNLEIDKRKLEKKIKNLNQNVELSIDEILNEKITNNIPVSSYDFSIDWSFYEYMKLDKLSWNNKVIKIKKKIDDVYEQKKPFLEDSNELLRKQMKNLKIDYKLDRKKKNELQKKIDEIIQNMYQKEKFKCIPKEEMFFAIDLSDSECKKIIKTKIEKKHFLFISFVYIITVLISFINVIFEAMFFVDSTLLLILILTFLLSLHIAVLVIYIVKNYFKISKYIKKFIFLLKKISQVLINEFTNYNHFQENLLNYIKGKRILDYNNDKVYLTKNNSSLKVLIDEKNMLQEQINYYKSLGKIFDLNDECFIEDTFVSLNQIFNFEIIKRDEYKKILFNDIYTLFSPYDYIKSLTIKEYKGDEDNDRIII